MAFELILLTGLIVIFVASFCGLLQKIRQSYEDERERHERAARQPASTLTEVYVNPTFAPEIVNGVPASEGIFPSNPPPYTEFYPEPPPKYEDIIKEQELSPPSTNQSIV